MFERFTEKAIKVLCCPRKKLATWVTTSGTEQLLLGLLGEETGVAAKVLKSMGVNLKDVRIEVENH